MTLAFPDYNKHGKLDYVAAWYSKAADFIHGTKTACAFLSTNSIVQGESVRVIYYFYDENNPIYLIYAYQKNSQSNLTEQEKKLFRQLVLQLKNSFRSKECSHHEQ